MTTVDASIPLQVQQPQFMTPNQAQSQSLSLRDLQLQTQLRQQQVQQGQNSLAVQSKMAQWAAQPGNVDKLTGQATDQGMQSLSTFAPTEIVQKFAGARQEFEKKNADQVKESEVIKQAQTTVTVTGAVLGNTALAAFSLDLQGITIAASVSAADTVTVTLRNNTGGVLDLGSGTLSATVIG